MMLLVNRSWRRMVVDSATVERAVGMAADSLGRSVICREGILAMRSGASGVSWNSLRALVFWMTCSI